MRCGGGANHRMGLADAALVKDNHVARGRRGRRGVRRRAVLEATIPVEIEVDSLEGLRVAIEAGADVVLLDNFELAEMRAAVARATRSGRAGARSRPAAASRSTSRRQVGETGVDYVAVGELTHSASRPRPRPRPRRGVLTCRSKAQAGAGR